MTVKYMSPARPIATSEVSQFKANIHRHFIGPDMTRSHTNHGKLRIGVIQVEKCELPKDFRGSPIGNRVLARNFIEKGWKGAGCSPLNVVIKRVNHLW
jgi:hypothetical protein